MSKLRLHKMCEQLTLQEQVRVPQILIAVSTILAAMLECQGPDDAMIAVTAALGSIELIDHLSKDRLAEATFEFVIDAVIKGRKHAKNR